MPILKKELSLFPEELFSPEYQHTAEERGKRWWAVYTTSKKEKEFMRRLVPKQVPFYCPIIANTYRSPQGRKRTSFIPLFSNYVFILADEEQRLEAFRTNCISKCLEIKDQHRLVDDLRQLEMFISTDIPVTPEERLVPGEAVRVKSGPFEGASGIVFQRRSQSRLLVQVDFLQSGASVEINDWELEKV